MSGGSIKPTKQSATLDTTNVVLCPRLVKFSTAVYNVFDINIDTAVLIVLVNISYKYVSFVKMEMSF